MCLQSDEMFDDRFGRAGAAPKEQLPLQGGSVERTPTQYVAGPGLSLPSTGSRRFGLHLTLPSASTVRCVRP